VEPVAVVVLPVEHEVHAVAPVADMYLPAAQPAQAVEAPAEAEYLPAAHDTHAADWIAPASAETVPAGQLVHVVVPVIAAYLPATQLVHTVRPSVAAAEPTVQLEHVPVSEEPPVTVPNWPAGQLVHVLMSVAAFAVEYLPATQLVHAALVAAAHVPAAHEVHWVLPVPAA
jgi:hypothetical protein